MRILAFDLATRCGWSLGHTCRSDDAMAIPITPGVHGPGSVSWSHYRIEGAGVETFTPKKGDHPGLRYQRFNKWAWPMIGALDTGDAVFYENSSFMQRSGAAAMVSPALITRVQEHCAVRGVSVHSIYPVTLKKYATGSGRAQKPEMIEAARKRWPRDLEQEGAIDDNLVDALWLLDYAFHELKF